jgi:hypothetical protein
MRLFKIAALLLYKKMSDTRHFSDTEPKTNWLDRISKCIAICVPTTAAWYGAKWYVRPNRVAARLMGKWWMPPVVCMIECVGKVISKSVAAASKRLFG